MIGKRITGHIRAALVMAALAVALPGAASAQDGVTVTLGFGAGYKPDYPGADSYSLGPTGRLAVNRVRLGPLAFGAPERQAERLGFGLRGAFRYLGAREAADHPELAGLKDIDAALELGLGLGYEAPRWRAFADLRYGVIGHESAVAELGADLKLVNRPDLEVTLGPRLLYGSDRYVSTYFGVSPAEATASGLPAFSPGGGLVSAGVELGVSYGLGPDWALEGRLGYDRLQGDAGRSPITGLGSREQGSVSLTLTRRISLGF